MLEKYALIEDEINIIYNDYNNKVNNSLIGVDVTDEISIFTEENFPHNDKERFPKMEFLNYEIFKRNIESVINNSNLIITTKEEDTSFLLNSSSDNLSNDSQSLVVQLQEVDNAINDFLLVIYSKDQVEDDLNNKLLNYFSTKSKNITSIEFTRKLIDTILIKAKNTTTLDFQNDSNLLIFSILMAEAMITISKNEEEYFDIYFAILFIASKSRYFNKITLNSYYLCSLLGNNLKVKKLTLNKDFWKRIILYKFDKRNISSEKSITNKYKDLTQKQKSYNKTTYQSSAASMLFSFGSKVKNILTRTNSSQFKLDDEHTLLLRKATNLNLLSVIKEFIPHMNYYRFNNDMTFSLVTDLINAYYIPINDESDYLIEVNNKLSYYKCLILINKHSIKRNVEMVNNVSIENTNIDIDVLLNSSSITKGVYSILNSLPYLLNDSTSLLNILQINKKLSYNLFSKSIYKQILRLKEEELSIEARIDIWFCLLKVNKLKENFNYFDLKKDIENMGNVKEMDNKLKKHFDVLLLDVKRTFFIDNVEEKRSIIERILQVVLYINPAISYCQGMNYIAAFCLEICKEEEKAFYLLFGLFTNTNYCELFYKDLSKLKLLFRVFERAINLKLPECFHYLNSCNINSSFYVSPWFITLFTNCYPNIVDIDNPLFLLKIFDMFILNGWQAIVLSGIMLMRNFAENIMSLKFEDLLNLLINDIIRSGCIQNNNYHKFINGFNYINYTPELHSELEEICSIE